VIINLKTSAFTYGKLVALSMLMVSVAEPDAAEQDLAKASQNPVADMLSLPMKNKFNFGLGEKDAFAYELELQPVYPVHLGSWNLINRLIVPISYQEAPFAGMNDVFGLRDATYQAFFSPTQPGQVIWGVGPTMIIPTHTNNRLGNDKWAIGPAALALTIHGPWVSGVLAQHFWDFAGDDDAASVNLSTLQYFINYNTPDYYLNTSPTMSYNWEASSDETWTIPLGGGIGKVMRFGGKPVDLRLSAYWNVEATQSAPDWFIEFQIKLLFPK
jgi:hypothetical protein